MKNTTQTFVVCPRCGRVAVGWPLKRTDDCSIDRYNVCFRNPETIIAKHPFAKTRRIDSFVIQCAEEARKP
jgi:hypothetical protein